MRLFVDPDVCQRHGRCAFLAPDVFRLSDDLEELEYVREPAEAYRLDVEEAVAACPTQAIELEG